MAKGMTDCPTPRRMASGDLSCPSCGRIWDFDEDRPGCSGSAIRRRQVGQDALDELHELLSTNPTNGKPRAY